jgi:hypothetical protein
MWNAGSLRKLLNNVPDETPIVVPSADHGYLPSTCIVTTALHEERNKWTEDHGEQVTPEAQYGKRVKVIVIQ